MRSEDSRRKTTSTRRRVPGKRWGEGRRRVTWEKNPLVPADGEKRENRTGPAPDDGGFKTAPPRHHSPAAAGARVVVVVVVDEEEEEDAGEEETYRRLATDSDVTRSETRARAQHTPTPELNSKHFPTSDDRHYPSRLPLLHEN